MSKSKNNGVDPQELIDRYGADTARLYTMFTAPPEATLEWNEAAVDGSFRFLKRVWAFASKHAESLQPANMQVSGALSAAATALRHELHSVLKQISFDFERMQYNTVVSGCMKLLNALESFKAEGEAQAAALLTEGFGILLRVLYPATPHITHALWESLGYAQTYGDLLDAPWPQPDSAALELAEIELVVQVNGKVRGSIRIAKDADKATIEQAALANENVQKFVAGNPVKKIVVVPGKLVSVVV